MTHGPIAAVVLLLWAGSGTSTGGALAVPDVAPPPAVIEALGPGGSAEAAVRGLLVADAAAGATGDLSFGDPVELRSYWFRTDGSDVIGADDVAATGAAWVAVVLLGSDPAGVAELAATGALAALHDRDDDLVRAIGVLENREVLLADGAFGELYAVSSDGRGVRALDDAGVALLGGEHVVGAREFRELKASQREAREDDPSARSARPLSQVPLPVIVATVGLGALVGAVALARLVVDRRGRRDQRGVRAR